MSEQPPDDSYPDAWKPAHVREHDAKRVECETHIASLSDAEIARIPEMCTCADGENDELYRLPQVRHGRPCRGR